MPKPLNILVVEDSPDDAELLVAGLQRAGYDPKWKRVETEPDFRAALENPPDLILSDYSMPQFNGLRAVKLLRELGLDVPFILVSGTVGEEAAVEAMKQGATDYLLKDRLGRLGNAVERALEQKRFRDERRRAEEQVRIQANALEAAANAILITDRKGTILSANTAFCTLTGYTLEELLGKNPRLLKSGKHDPDFYRGLWDAVLRGQVWRGDMENRRKDGTLYHEEMTITPVRTNGGEITHFIAVKEEITERKRAEVVLTKASRQAFGRQRKRMVRDLAVIIALGVLSFGFFFFSDILQSLLDAVLNHTDILDEVVGTLAVLVVGLAVLAYRLWKDARGQISQQRLTLNITIRFRLEKSDELFSWRSVWKICQPSRRKRRA